MMAGSADELTELRLLHALSLLAVPVAFAGAALRRRLERGAVADVVLGLSGASRPAVSTYELSSGTQ